MTCIMTCIMIIYGDDTHHDIVPSWLYILSYNLKVWSFIALWSLLVTPGNDMDYNMKNESSKKYFSLYIMYIYI